jgi:hypothetical protein
MDPWVHHRTWFSVKEICRQLDKRKIALTRKQHAIIKMIQKHPNSGDVGRTIKIA